MDSRPPRRRFRLGAIGYLLGVVIILVVLTMLALGRTQEDNATITLLIFVAAALLGVADVLRRNGH